MTVVAPMSLTVLVMNLKKCANAILIFLVATHKQNSGFVHRIKLDYVNLIIVCQFVSETSAVTHDWNVQTPNQASIMHHFKWILLLNPKHVIFAISSISCPYYLRNLPNLKKNNMSRAFSTINLQHGYFLEEPKVFYIRK